jgi:hypothetical protein
MSPKKKKPALEFSGEAIIEGGDIVIRVAIEALPNAVKYGSDLMAIDPPLKITNAKVFAKELVSALNEEDEDGSTPIHKLFDQGVMDAAEAGAEGCESADDDADL